jgi:hypothetical protein
MEDMGESAVYSMSSMDMCEIYVYTYIYTYIVAYVAANRNHFAYTI